MFAAINVVGKSELRWYLKKETKDKNNDMLKETVKFENLSMNSKQTYISIDHVLNPFLIHTKFKDNKMLMDNASYIQDYN